VNRQWVGLRNSAGQRQRPPNTFATLSARDPCAWSCPCYKASTFSGSGFRVSKSRPRGAACRGGFASSRPAAIAGAGLEIRTTAGQDRLRKKASSQRRNRAGAKAHYDFSALTARLKSCPDTSCSPIRVFPQLLKPSPLRVEWRPALRSGSLQPGGTGSDAVDFLGGFAEDAVEDLVSKLD
jgi:hypothetical protein